MVHFLVSALGKYRQEEQGFQRILGHTGVPGQHIHMVHTHHKHEKRRVRGGEGGESEEGGRRLIIDPLLFSTLASKMNIKC